MGGLPALWAEYNTMDKNGKPVDLSNRNTYYYKKDSNGNISEERFDVQAVLSAEEAAAYTIKNVLSGDDAWDPALMTEPCEKPNGYISDNKLTWSEVPYAICYLITNGEDVIGFTTECEFSVSGEGNYMIQAINEFGGLSEAASFETTSLKETEKSLTIVSVKYFSVDGIQRVEAEKGINIVQYRMNDGSVKTEKVFIR